MSSIHSLPADPWVSTRHLQRALVFLNARGIDADAVLRHADLSPDQLADGEGKVPLELLEKLLLVYQQRHPDPFIGLHMAEDLQPTMLGALGFLMQSCTTLADLLDISVRFNGLMSNIGHTSVRHSPGQFEIRWDCLAGSPALRRQLSEYIMGMSLVMKRLLLPHAAQPLAIQFMHPHPVQAEHSRIYFDFFGCPVFFGSPYTAITLPASMLTMRIPYGDATLRALLEQHAQGVLARRAQPDSLPDDVRRLLQSLVLTGNATREAVARQLGTSTRSLHRRLEEAGTSYRELLDQVRLKMAQAELAASDTPMAGLAERLGFSSPQAFMRWFRLLSGVTPGQYRRQILAARGPGETGQGGSPGIGAEASSYGCEVG